MNKLIVTLALGLAITATTQAQVIRTIAGTVTSGLSGAGSTGISTPAANVSAIVTATDGTIYICDKVNHTIRKITTDLLTSTIAGTNGIPGYLGDGGPATSALLKNPTGLAIDATGNIYVADKGNNAVRMISTSGTITTLANLSATAVTVDGSGNIFVADGINRVWKIAVGGATTAFAGNGTTGYTGDGATATLASLNNPTGVSTDNLGNVYIADGANNVVRKVNNAGIITTIAGTGLSGYNGDYISAVTATLNSPAGIHTDAAGNVYVADLGNNRIRKIDINGNITTISGNGTAAYTGDGGNPSSASLNAPVDFNFNFAGNLLIADNGNNVIREVVYPGSTTMNMGWATSMCAGTSVTFFPVTSNNLYGVTYQWNVNGVNTGTTTESYFTNTLTDGDQVRCYLLDAFHGFIIDSEAVTTVNVIANVTPAVNITASTGTVLSGETDITFNAAEVNGGTAPTFQWFVNNEPVPGATDASYTSYYLAPGAHVNVTLTSNANCLVTNDVTSNTLIATLVMGQPLAHQPGGIILVAPNPNNGQMTMKVQAGSDISGQFQYWITDITGKMIFRNNATLTHGSFEVSINLNNDLPQGIYTITANAGDHKLSVPFVLNK
jgi:Secretion system C-terminal sorting domain/NHL repeat